MEDGSGMVLLVWIIASSFTVCVIGDTTDTPNYVGCFEDMVNRIMDQNTQNISLAVTNEVCVEHCRSLGRALAGTENAFECYCGDVRKNYSMTPDSQCSIPCQGDSTQMCGGPWRVSIYSTAISDWAGWGQWSVCTVTCGGGTQERTRNCTDIIPDSCHGNKQQTQSCNQQSCVVHGLWGTWGSWSSCGVTCGGGMRSQNRSCDNPPPANGGQTCQGSNVKYDTCSTSACPGQQACTSQWFTCRSDTTNCLVKENKCDCVNHCADGSDEDRSHVGCGVTVDFNCNTGSVPQSENGVIGGMTTAVVLALMSLK